MDEQERQFRQILLNQMLSIVDCLEEIRDELRQMNQANEPDPDAEPDPFQTLNGPRQRTSLNPGEVMPDGYGHCPVCWQIGPLDKACDAGH